MRVGMPAVGASEAVTRGTKQGCHADVFGRTDGRTDGRTIGRWPWGRP
jgi:hypothetical protein